MSSIHQRLAEIHQNLMNMKIEKSGRNKHKGFNYYELEDMVPPILKECAEKEISVEFTYCEGVAILKLVDWNDPKQYIPFRVAMPELVVEEKNPNNKLIQALGANITYLQRYLLKLAFPCLTDKDVIDSDVEERNTASSDNNETTSDRPEQKAEKVSSNINVPMLVVEAEKTLKKKGVSDKDIDFKAIKRQVLKSRNFSVSERREIIDYFKKRDKGGS